MPRKRLYHTKDERIAADRLKWRSYYERKKTKILEGRKERRRLQKDEQTKVQRKHKSTIRDAHNPSQRNPVPQSEKAPFWETHAKNILQRLVKATTKYPCRFLDRLCFDYVTSRSPSAFEQCLEKVEALDRAYHRTMQGVLNYLGANETYRQLNMHQEVFTTLKQWLYSILCDILEGKDIVEEQRNQQLTYQKDNELVISVEA